MRSELPGAPDHDLNGQKGESLAVSVRVLAESVHRSGGLAGIQYGLLTAAVGVRTHRLFCEKLVDLFPDARIETEHPLSVKTSVKDVSIALTGRCDAVVTLPSHVLVIEAKTHLTPADQLPPDGEPVHWAQAMLYAALYVRQHEPSLPIQVALAYVSADTIDVTLLTRTVDLSDLDRFLLATVESWSEIALAMKRLVQLRDESGKALYFPFPALRSGQKRLMKEVVGITRHRQPLFACAPTGIGKTMAVLYPGIKALCHHLTDRIFYLTAMTSTRLAAEKACDALREKGMKLRSVTLTAKEKICLMPDLYCDQRVCPLAVHYYDHLSQAMTELLTVPALNEGILKAVAQRYGLCPFELSLDLALFADVVIGDYNYAFDPRVRLERFFVSGEEHDLLLVDEAHNLPDRAREMFTARLSWKGFRDTAKALAGQSAALDRSIQSLIHYGETVATGMRGKEPFLDLVERGIKPSDVMSAEDFRAIKTRPSSLNSMLGRVSLDFRNLLDANPELPERRVVLDTYFSILFFLKVNEEYDPAAYVTTYASSEVVDLEVKLLCLDASDFLRQQIMGLHAAVFFSATLNPMDYYQSLIVGRQGIPESESLVLPSPFPAENLLMMRCTRFSTRYHDRGDTVAQIAGLIAAAVTCRTGNTLVFVPSFSYLNLIRFLLKEKLGKEPAKGLLPDQAPIRLLFQKPQMSDREKNAFLQAFSQFGNTTLVGVAVTGGQFSEGIDLIGEQLSGVVIVGVGLPKINPELEIMRQYYTEKLGSGFEYAYQYPGFNRVQQAAGRVIRSESDRGFVLLIDDRYSRPDYEALFPPEWNVRDVDSEQSIKEHLHDFQQS